MKMAKDKHILSRVRTLILRFDRRRKMKLSDWKLYFPNLKKPITEMSVEELLALKKTLQELEKEWAAFERNNGNVRIARVRSSERRCSSKRSAHVTLG